MIAARVRQHPFVGPTPPSRGVFSLLEAAYAVDLPRDAWALGLLKSVEEIVNGGIGGFACAVDFSKDGTLAIDRESAVSLGVPDEMVALIFSSLNSAPPEWLRQSLRTLRGSAACVLTSQFDPERLLGYRSRLATSGIDDGVNIVARDLDDRGFLISLGIKRNHRISGALRQDLKKASTHVLAALRLRRRLRVDAAAGASASGDPSTCDAEPEAVLSSSGRWLHLRGDATLASARRKLELAVSDIERARADRVDDRRRAPHRWKGLVADRWSLVDRYQQGGKKYVVARENLPQAAGMVGLTRTESTVVAYIAKGFTTKETAYSLGISDTTVRVLMMRAVRRTGFKNRREVVEAWTRGA